MKKVFFLVAILFATASFSQITESTQSAGITPCPPCPQVTVVNPIQKPIPVRKVYVTPKPGAISNSFNTNITVNNYPAPVLGNDHREYHYDEGWEIPLLLLLLILFAVGLGYLLFHDRSNGVAHVDIHNHIPAAPVTSKSEPVKQGPPMDAKEAMEKAASCGGSFSTRTDGSWKVEFPKPPTEKKESA